MSLGPALLRLVSFAEPGEADAPPHGTCTATLCTAAGDLRCHLHADILRVRAPTLWAQLRPRAPTPVPCDGPTLRLLVEYIYTDKAPLSRCRRASLPAVAALAEDYGIPGLAQRIHRLLHPRTDAEASPGLQDNAPSGPSFAQQLAALQTDPTLADTCVRHPAGDAWLASAAVLAARSQYLERLFSGRWEAARVGPDGRWLVEAPEELPPEAVHDAVRHAHAQDAWLGWLPAKAVDRALALLPASDFFAMPDLFEDAQAYLLRCLEVGTVGRLWTEARRAGAEELEDGAVRFLKDHIACLPPEAAAWAAVPRGLLFAVLGNGHLEVSPQWLQEALLRWAWLQLAGREKGPVAEGACWAHISDLLPPNTLFCAADRQAVFGREKE